VREVEDCKACLDLTSTSAAVLGVAGSRERCEEVMLRDLRRGVDGIDEETSKDSLAGITLFFVGESTRCVSSEGMGVQ